MSEIPPPDSTPLVDNSAKEAREGRSDVFRALLASVLAVLVVRSFLFEPFKIPSSSMMPTLKIGDHIFVSKFNYGFSIPFTKIELLRWSEPRRGEVIVFLFPRDETLHYIKRVLGVPGDRIEFKGKDIYVNGELVPKDAVSDESIIASVTGNPSFTGELYKERLGDTVHYVKYSSRLGSEVTRDIPGEVVPPGKFFVVGDNRDDSYDSRSWGYVPREYIKGKAQLVWLSLDQEENWTRISKIRWSRCGTIIH